jgi:antitoxin component YwqK of YwqJK toxin-antitoxin module
MKYITVILLLITLNVNCQIWKEPFDTLPYVDQFERLTGVRIGIKSYTITEFSDKDSILSYDYYGFDKSGYLTEQFYAMFPKQHTDTIKYYYTNGIVQGADFKREHIYNDHNRLIEIRNTNNDSTWSTYYIYKKNKLAGIRYSKLNLTKFQYDSLGKLQRKEVLQNGKLKEYFNYYYPEKNVTAYCNCNQIKVYDETINACDSTIGTFNKFGKLIKLEVHIYKEHAAHLMTVNYNDEGMILEILYEEPSGFASEVYRRDKIGLLTRIDFYKNEELYKYSKFDYLFY